MMRVDIRYVDYSHLDNLIKKIKKIVIDSSVVSPEDGASTITKIHHIAQLPSMSSNSSKDIFALAVQAGNKLGKKIKGVHVGYGSDGNHLSEFKGIQILVGVGAYGGGMHTEKEFMLKNSYNSRLDFNIALLYKLTS